MPVKKIENRSVFHEYMDESLRLTFLGHPVVYMLLAMQMDAYTLRSTAVFTFSHVQQPVEIKF